MDVEDIHLHQCIRPEILGNLVSYVRGLCTRYPRINIWVEKSFPHPEKLWYIVMIAKCVPIETNSAFVPSCSPRYKMNSRTWSEYATANHVSFEPSAIYLVFNCGHDFTPCHHSLTCILQYTSYQEPIRQVTWIFASWM